NNLGRMYENGQGVAPDPTDAAKWYRTAAERGFGGAQNNLALLTAFGKGVTKDPVEAAKWFSLAAQHGDNNGADVRAGLLKEMTPAQIAEAEKRAKEFTAKP
ncbi:MAG: tetratricopeptide repeat protein, partial [Verrucomicrobia bacterium]|nr:tetratricopeptide repeat protein [Verrucomicrobiota bacterium]